MALMHLLVSAAQVKRNQFQAKKEKIRVNVWTSNYEVLCQGIISFIDTQILLIMIFFLNLYIQNMYLVKCCPQHPSNQQNKGIIFSFVSRKPFTSITNKLHPFHVITYGLFGSVPQQASKFWPCPCNLAGLQC